MPAPSDKDKAKRRFNSKDKSRGKDKDKGGKKDWKDKKSSNKPDGGDKDAKKGAAVTLFASRLVLPYDDIYTLASKTFSSTSVGTAKNSAMLRAIFSFFLFPR